MSDGKAHGETAEFSLDFVGGPIKFRAEEGVFYSKLFHIVCEKK